MCWTDKQLKNIFHYFISSNVNTAFLLVSTIQFVVTGNSDLRLCLNVFQKRLNYHNFQLTSKFSESDKYNPVVFIAVLSVFKKLNLKIMPTATAVLKSPGKIYCRTPFQNDIPTLDRNKFCVEAGYIIVFRRFRPEALRIRLYI